MQGYAISLRERPSRQPPMPVRFAAMDAGTVVALIAALLATSVAVIVPWVTFRFALRQDHIHWIGDQRSELYVDMLAEAYAEHGPGKLAVCRPSGVSPGLGCPV